MAYLDHAATTPMRSEAILATVSALEIVGNPASIHSPGQQAKKLLEEAREQIATALGADPIEVIFTASGTEAINLAIKGIYWQRQKENVNRTRILVPAGEHHATIDTVNWLADHEGADIDEIPLDALGRINLSALAAALNREPENIALVTMLWANNEIGTIQPVTSVAGLTAAAGVPLHLDAVAAWGQLPVDLHALRADVGSAGVGPIAISVSAHKIGGPVGIGALVLDRTASVEPLVHGGGQQRKIHSGTQDVAAASGFAAAAVAVARNIAQETTRMAQLRDRLIAGVTAAVPSAILSGDPAGSGRLPGNAHFIFPGCQGDSLLFLLDAAGVAVSTGSACQAGVPEPSHVVLAVGRSERDARGALRMTLGHDSTEKDVADFLAALPSAYSRAWQAGLTSNRRAG